jgi:hypothetical protein
VERSSSESQETEKSEKRKVQRGGGSGWIKRCEKKGNLGLGAECSWGEVAEQGKVPGLSTQLPAKSLIGPTEAWANSLAVFAVILAAAELNLAVTGHRSCISRYLVLLLMKDRPVCLVFQVEPALQYMAVHANIDLSP